MKDFKDFTKMTYYEILDIDSSAAELEIQTAFETARRTYEPDAVGVYTLFTAEELDLVREKIKDAYNTLNNAESRRAYDRALGLPVPEDGQMTPEGEQSPPSEETGEGEVLSDPGEVIKKKKETDIRIGFVDEEISFFNGVNLQKLREKKGMTIETISGITKISPMFLKKIEKDEYEGLPERVFVRGFVKEFAKCLKLDHEKAMADFIKGYDEWREKNQKK